MANNNIYKTDLREFDFLLWEQFTKAKDVFDSELYKSCTEDTIGEILTRAKRFSYEHLGAAYQASDEQGCKLEDGKVTLPKEYPELWQRFKEDWGNMASIDGSSSTSMPPFAMQMLLEMFMGANPSFMTYGGFCLPSSVLVEKYGTELQKSLFKEKLATSEWTSCLTLTEPQAGSDVSLVNTKAKKQDDGTYLLTGEKYLISAGMHDLTENTVYFVMGRGDESSEGTFGLSCFIVPKYWVEEDGSIGDFNNVECIGLADKMGFNGCANTHLTFGKNGPCKAYLMGNREKVGLLQFLTLMNQARISTGVYALGMASSAYLNALNYATQRLQGKKFHESFNPAAQRVNIIGHVDVQRMLLEMKSKVEGCRALIAKLTLSESLINVYKNNPDKKDDVFKQQGLMNLLTPVVKAYVSDNAWRICELAIQTCGGKGYLKDLGIEQYARDVKVLAIWEGTNYIQSQDLIRDKLGMGATGKLYRIYQEEIETFLGHANDFPEFTSEFRQLSTSYNHLTEALNQVQAWVKSKQLNRIPAYSTRILHLMGDVTIAWLLLEAATVSAAALTKDNRRQTDDFYEGKIHSARFFINNELPRSQVTLNIIKNEASYTEVSAERWNALLKGVSEL